MSATPQLVIFENRELLFRGAADAIARELLDAIAAGGVCSIALSGGSTPVGVYERLSTDAKIDWAIVDIFWGDERYVPPNHPDSNYRMVHQALLSKIRVRPANVHRVVTDDPDPDRAARLYEDEIRAVFHLGATDFPRFDVALLGLGRDGHTASLFAGSPALNERRRIVVSVRVEAPRSARITLTPPAINRSACIIFLVAGEEKAAAVRGVLRDPYDPEKWPAQIIRPSRGRLLFLVEREAARLV